MIFAIVTFIAGIVIAVVESTFLNSIAILGVRPDVAVLIVAVATCRTDFRKSMILATTIGLARDFVSGGVVSMNADLVWGTMTAAGGNPGELASGGIVGMTVFSMIVMAYFLVLAQDYLLTRNWRSQCFMVFLGFLVFAVTFVMLKIVLGFEIGPPLKLLEQMIPTACYTALLAPWAFMMARRTDVPSYLRLKRKYRSDYETLPEAKV